MQPGFCGCAVAALLFCRAGLELGIAPSSAVCRLSESSLPRPAVVNITLLVAKIYAYVLSGSKAVLASAADR